MWKNIIFTLFLGGIFFLANAQDISVGDPDILSVRKKEWDVYGTIHTNGFGIGARFGNQNTIHKRSGFDVEFTYYKHFKEQRGTTSYSYESKSFIYGKLNSFFQLRFGYGFTQILNTKPYWKGIDVGYFLYGGASIGFSVPVYLKIIEYIEEDSIYGLVTEKYDPEEHDLSNIYGKAPFVTGLSETKIHPGIYLKTGLTFDFSDDDAKILALDFGLAADAYYTGVKKLAYVKEQYVLITGFITLHLGKKLTNYR